MALGQLALVLWQWKCLSRDLAKRVSATSVLWNGAIDVYIGVWFLFTAIMWSPWFYSFAIVAASKLLLGFVAEVRLGLWLKRVHNPYMRANAGRAIRFALMFPNVAQFILAVFFAFIVSYLLWVRLVCVCVCARAPPLLQIKLTTTCCADRTTSLCSLYVCTRSGFHKFCSPRCSG
mgnify:CR=1 FL=1